jgi:hypothetical protein
MPDLGLTHVALSVRDLDASIAFYEKYARMVVVHRRARESVRSAWITDHTRPSSSCWLRPQTSTIRRSGHSGILASLARAVKRSIGYTRRPAARAGRPVPRSTRATRSVTPRASPIPTAIHSNSPLAKRSASPLKQRPKVSVVGLNECRWRFGAPTKRARRWNASIMSIMLRTLSARADRSSLAAACAASPEVPPVVARTRRR